LSEVQHRGGADFHRSAVSLRRHTGKPAFTVGGEGKCDAKLVTAHIRELPQNVIVARRLSQSVEDVSDDDPQAANARLGRHAWPRSMVMMSRLFMERILLIKAAPVKPWALAWQVHAEFALGRSSLQKTSYPVGAPLSPGSGDAIQKARN
jgi:hypothetical protein